MWYRYALKKYSASLNETLDQLQQDHGVDPQVTDYVRGLHPADIGRHIGYLRQNPAHTVETLQQAASSNQPKQTYSPTPFESSVVQRYNPAYQKWALQQMRKLRQPSGTPGDFYYRGFTLPADQRDPNVHPVDQDALRRQFDTMHDWHSRYTRDNPTFDIASQSLSQASAASDAWHRTMAGQGEGKYYLPYRRNDVGEIDDPRVVHRFDNGWYMSQVDNDNDLKVEGNLMNHCVGGYCDDVNNGKSRIYSLRDHKNHPHVTVETDGIGYVKNQTQGNSNRKPVPDHQRMIDEWWGKHRAGIPLADILKAFEEGKLPFYELPAYLKNDPQFVRQAYEAGRAHFGDLPSELREDPQFAREAYEAGRAHFGDLPSELREDPQFAREAYEAERAEFRDLPEALKQDPELAMEALKNNRVKLWMLPPVLGHDPQFAMEALKNNRVKLWMLPPVLGYDPQFVKRVFDAGLTKYHDLPNVLREDVEFSKYAYDTNRAAYEEMPYQLKINPVFSLQALKSGRTRYRQVPDALRQNPEFAKQAYDAGYARYSEMPEVFRNDLEFSRNAFAEGKAYYHDLPDILKHDPNIANIALEKKSIFYDDLPERLKGHPALQHHEQSKRNTRFHVYAFKGSPKP